jgi:hypothetical protein
MCEILVTQKAEIGRVVDESRPWVKKKKERKKHETQNS